MDLLNKLEKWRKLPHKIIRMWERQCNKHHAYDYPETSGGWRKYGSKPVYGNISTGSIFDPYVQKCGEEYVMYASERNSGSIIRLESSDGKSWKNKQVCLCGGCLKWAASVNRACVMPKDNEWHMWFTGQKNNFSVIGYARSKDGILFHPVSDIPALHPIEAYEGNSVMNPCVLWDARKSIYKMWYSAGEDYEPDVICYAESSDGMLWQRYREPVMRPDKKYKYAQYKLGGCDVKYLNGKYVMFYIGYQNLDVARICNAESIDGIHWMPSVDNPIIAPTYGSWDADAVYKPSVVSEGETFLLWYNGRHKRREYIGLALFGE